MRKLNIILTSVPAAALLAITAACADAPTSAPRLAPGAAPDRASSSYVQSQVTVGDTTVTVFVVTTNSASPATFNIGNASKIDFPYAASSICDPLTSSYGAGTWDSPCSASKVPVTITARSWINAQGKVATDFQPALRFVPGLKRSVTLTLRDAALAGTRIDFCTLTGCVDEAATDPSLTTTLDASNGFAYRVIKHFSGYTVTAD